jgi:hypothetical protein
VVPVREVGEERTTVALRVGHLLRITGYLELATIGMWTGSPRTQAMIGMAEASVRGEAPGGSDEDLLRRLRALVAEARDYQAGEDIPAAMARLHVAQDLVDLRIVALSEG